jgi:hypothetical protein
LPFLTEIAEMLSGQTKGLSGLVQRMRRLVIHVCVETYEGSMDEYEDFMAARILKQMLEKTAEIARFPLLPRRELCPSGRLGLRKRHCEAPVACGRVDDC